MLVGLEVGIGAAVGTGKGGAVAVGRGKGIAEVVGQGVGVGVATANGVGTAVATAACVVAHSAGVWVRKATGVITIGPGVDRAQATPVAIKISIKTRKLTLLNLSPMPVQPRLRWR